MLTTSIIVDSGTKSKASIKSEMFWKMCRETGEFAVSGIFGIFNPKSNEEIPSRLS
jgi:hypothetical protein